VLCTVQCVLLELLTPSFTLLWHSCCFGVWILELCSCGVVFSPDVIITGSKILSSWHLVALCDCFGEATSLYITSFTHSTYLVCNWLNVVGSLGSSNLRIYSERLSKSLRPHTCNSASELPNGVIKCDFIFGSSAKWRRARNSYLFRTHYNQFIFFTCLCGRLERNTPNTCWGTESGYLEWKLQGDEPFFCVHYTFCVVQLSR
jgi:hypothetical protein